MDTFKLILNVAYAVLKLFMKTSEKNEKEVQAVKKELKNALKEKDKKKKASRINAVLGHIDRM